MLLNVVAGGERARDPFGCTAQKAREGNESNQIRKSTGITGANAILQCKRQQASLTLLGARNIREA